MSTNEVNFTSSFETETPMEIVLKTDSGVNKTYVFSGMSPTCPKAPGTICIVNEGGYSVFTRKNTNETFIPLPVIPEYRSKPTHNPNIDMYSMVDPINYFQSQKNRF